MKTRLNYVLTCICVLCFSFGSRNTATTPPDNCNPNAIAFNGYTFISPGIIEQNAAYAPYLVRFGDRYNDYLEKDIAKNENLREWQQRFCSAAPTQDIERIVYLGSDSEQETLIAACKSEAKEAPSPFKQNLFADLIVSSQCTEVPEYIKFANSCQIHVTPKSNQWKPELRDSMRMANLIKEGLDLFNHTNSHFIRQRIAYQVVRLAHYNQSYRQTIELYNFLTPKIDRRRRSIIYFWTLGHMAGALQKLGKRPDAAYRYMQIFRSDPGKRATAHRSFYLRNETEWKAALALCQDDSERASMYIMRAAGAKVKSIQDLKSIYHLDPQNEQLGLLLVSTVQSLERVMLNNQFTELKNNQIPQKALRDEASVRVIELQEFVHEVTQSGKANNIKLWKCIDAYLSVLRFDQYQAELSLKACMAILNPKDKYEAELIHQVKIWTHLNQIHQLNAQDTYAADGAFRLRSYAIHSLIPQFEPYLRERLAVAFGKSHQPGKAIVTAFDRNAILFNPKLDQLDDLLSSFEQNGTAPSSAIETDIILDTLMKPDMDFFVEAKGMMLLGMAQPEAAYQILRKHAPAYKGKQFAPFEERIGERVHKLAVDTINVTRQELAAKILEFQFAAKAHFTEPNKAAKYYYLLGLCYYNTTYFGHSWEAFDAFRSGRNWDRLAQGPVFGAANTPLGNLEILDMRTAIQYFEEALRTTQDKEMGAKATFMLAKCQQKQWFCDKRSAYKPGNKEIPVLPSEFSTYQKQFLQQYQKTSFYQDVITECKWFEAYARRK
jgi:hypothetical protein